MRLEPAALRSRVKHSTTALPKFGVDFLEIILIASEYEDVPVCENLVLFAQSSFYHVSLLHS